MYLRNEIRLCPPGDGIPLWEKTIYGSIDEFCKIVENLGNFYDQKNKLAVDMRNINGMLSEDRIECTKLDKATDNVLADNVLFAIATEEG